MKINVKSSMMVKPMVEIPGGTLLFANVDLLMPATCHTHVIYFYRTSGTADFFDAAVLKAALSRTLVEFYPHAGRLRRGANNRLEVDCNGEGVLFVEAECDATLDDFGDFIYPKAELRLIPAIDYSQGISSVPLYLVQLTRFKCGGVSLGIANEHHLSDGIAGLHFTNTWSDLARGGTIGIPPFYDRTVLAARSPPRPIFPHIEYQPPPRLATPLPQLDTTFSLFKLTRDQMNALKAKCNDGNGPNYSTFAVLAGHAWRCACMARGLPANQKTKLHIPVDGRNRLIPPPPSGYHGNVLFSPPTVALSGELVSNPLKFAVGRVHEAITRLDDEYLRSAMDYLEVQGDVSALARSTDTTRCPNLGIITWTRLPLYDADFGWGKPDSVGPGGAPYEGKSYVLASPDNDGSVLYGLALYEPHMKLFKNFFYDAIFK